MSMTYWEQECRDTVNRRLRQPVGRGKKLIKKKDEIRAWLIAEKGWNPDKYGHLQKIGRGKAASHGVPKDRLAVRDPKHTWRMAKKLQRVLHESVHR
jgi:hypothetical protein